MPPSAPVAQWIERPPPKRQVAGSIPARGTIKSSSCVNAPPFSSEYVHHMSTEQGRGWWTWRCCGNARGLVAAGSGRSEQKEGVSRSGQDIRLKTEAEAWARQIESEMDRGVFVSRAEAESTTLAEALERYIREVLPGKKSRRVILSQTKYLTPRLGNLLLSAITSSILARYRDQRLADGAAAQTAKHDLSLISRVLNTAIKEWGIDLPAGNPVLQIRMPRVANARDRRLVGDEQARLLGAAEAYDSTPMREVMSALSLPGP